MMNLAKSLHTITVYQRLVLYFISVGYTEPDAVDFTKQILGHDDMTDDYGLVDKALANVMKLTNGKQNEATMIILRRGGKS